MKILYDHQIFTEQQYGGISRYFFELIKRYENNENSCEVATFFSNNAYYNKSFNPSLNKFLPENNFKGKVRLANYLNKVQSLNKVAKGDFDVFHPTYYNDSFISKIKNKPFVVTFYDMIHEKFSDQFEILKSDDKILDNKKRLLEKSSRVIAISQTTKNDIIELFDVDSSKIDVVYLGSSLENFNIENKSLVEEDYVLFVGNRGNYKNFDFFLNAIAELLIQENLKLVCAGGGEFSHEERILISFLKLDSRVIFKKILNDNDLSNYYSNALFFCFPSLYEGFGIPVLEAFASGCPILLSNGGSLPEVGGDAAIYFDPTDQDSLRKSMIELLNDEKLRFLLKEKGYKRLEKFSWDKTFENHLDVYKSIIKV
ncbi:glycosyltransferase family 4 protein [Flavobacterium chungbukense]|uniref:Glycosyltransferase family 1 protein n=1 Tax=Flavobacterium chungbukense TaxID=877464 RepID=A0ABP7XKW5_9FLAO|nr:glycosyltransferase family 1 protein [Flavobacterium chungbukense]MCC4922972.1 glycosyltransferase family 4 protein [Flavobacterium chungbukense]